LVKNAWRQYRKLLYYIQELGGLFLGGNVRDLNATMRFTDRRSMLVDPVFAQKTPFSPIYHIFLIFFQKTLAYICCYYYSSIISIWSVMID